MADEDGDKTEAPTQRRREEAREQGQVARSPDLTAAAILLGFLLLMNSFGRGLMEALRALTAQLLSAESLSRFDTVSLRELIGKPLIAVAGALAPLLIGAAVVAVLVNLVQVGFVFSSKRITPNFGAIDPVKGFGRLVRADNFVHLLVNLLKVTLAGVLAWSAIRDRLPEIIAIQDLEHGQAFLLGASLIYAVGIRIAVLLLVLAVLDYGYQRWKHERELRMTKREVKEEMRRMEGDPKIKQRRRQLAMQMAMKSMRRNVPTADVVVTNPTHFAVALKYEQATMHAPRVVAKGADLMAQRVRELAAEHGVPIVERKTLARALYAMCEVGQEVPEEHYKAVAEILAYVYEISGKLTRQTT